MHKFPARIAIVALAALGLLVASAPPSATAAFDDSAGTTPVQQAVSPKTTAKQNAPTPPGSGTADEFTLAVFPDTQKWVFPGDSRFSGATTWLANNAKRDNLRYVLHTGDITNWGWLAPSQFDIMENALGKLDQVGIPYQLSVGNHDARVVGWDGVEGSRKYGGNAYVGNPECRERFGDSGCNSSALIRQTDEISKRIEARDRRSEVGQFKAGKIENSYHKFKAGGRDWLVLSLEYNARTTVVTWAQSVVKRYPNHNVIVQTHQYLDGNGAISRSNGGYGTNSGQYLYDKLIGKYANIRLVFSGHTGKATSRVDTGVNGNKIISMQQNDVTNGSGNALRIVRINGATGEITSTIQAPDQNRTYSDYNGRWVVGLR